MTDGTFSRITSIDLFWRDVLWLLGDVGAYARAKKLSDNLCNPERRHKVWHVFMQYYKGDFGRLNTVIAERRSDCLNDIRSLNARLRGFDLTTVEVPEQLLSMLLDPDRRGKYKRLAEKHRRDHDIISLTTLEREYQKSGKRAST